MVERIKQINSDQSPYDRNAYPYNLITQRQGDEERGDIGGA